MCASIYVIVCEHIYICVCMHVYVFVVFVYIYIYIYIYIYKRIIIKTLVSRPKLSSSQNIFLNELKNIKLINNGFPNYIVDTEIKHFINKMEQHNIDKAINNQ